MFPALVARRRSIFADLPELARLAFAHVAVTLLFAVVFLATAKAAPYVVGDRVRVLTDRYAFDLAWVLTILVIGLSTMLLWAALMVRRPPTHDRERFHHVGFVDTTDQGMGGLWISSLDVQVVTGLRHRTIALAAIRDARVASDALWLLRPMLPRCCLLVLVLEDGSEVRLFVYTPQRVARCIREARDRYADMLRTPPYREPLEGI